MQTGTVNSEHWFDIDYTLRRY